MSRGSIPTDGAAIRYHRQMAGLTLRMLAANANVSPGYLSKLERDQADARPPTLKRLADALNLTVRDLSPQTQRVPTAA